MNNGLALRLRRVGSTRTRTQDAESSRYTYLLSAGCWRGSLVSINPPTRSPCGYSLLRRSRQPQGRPSRLAARAVYHTEPLIAACSQAFDHGLRPFDTTNRKSTIKKRLAWLSLCSLPSPLNKPPALPICWSPHDPLTSAPEPRPRTGPTPPTRPRSEPAAVRPRARLGGPGPAAAARAWSPAAAPTRALSPHRMRRRRPRPPTRASMPRPMLPSRPMPPRLQAIQSPPAVRHPRRCFRCVRRRRRRRGGSALQSARAPQRGPPASTHRKKQPTEVVTCL